MPHPRLTLTPDHQQVLYALVRTFVHAPFVDCDDVHGVYLEGRFTLSDLQALTALLTHQAAELAALPPQPYDGTQAWLT